MKTTVAIMLALAIAATSGCASSRGGGLSTDEGFRITTPTFATDIKQGEQKMVNVSLKRDKYFKQDVKLQTTSTSGISVEPSKMLVKASESPDVQFQIKVPADAALGEYLVHVVATPETGAPTSQSFTVKVVGP